MEAGKSPASIRGCPRIKKAHGSSPATNEKVWLAFGSEHWRVLKPGALFQGTMRPTRNINYGRGRTVAPDTFVVDGAEERGHPHFYCDAATLVALFVAAQRCHIGNTIGAHLGRIIGRALERFSIGLLHPPIPFVGLARITPTPTRPIEGAGVRFQALPL